MNIYEVNIHIINANVSASYKTLNYDTEMKLLEERDTLLVPLCELRVVTKHRSVREL